MRPRRAAPYCFSMKRMRSSASGPRSRTVTTATPTSKSATCCSAWRAFRAWPFSLPISSRRWTRRFSGGFASAWTFRSRMPCSVKRSGHSSFQSRHPLPNSNLAAAQNAEAVTCEGSLDVTRYGGVLNARQLVGVRGSGPAFDGLYYVKSVTHKIKRGEYKQNFMLTRNGLVSTVQTVNPSAQTPPAPPRRSATTESSVER